MNRLAHKNLVKAALLVLMTPLAALAQLPPAVAPETQARPKTPRRPPAGPNGVVVLPRAQTDAPQVVTIVHQLSGIKILRFILRQVGDREVVEVNEPLAMTNDVHTNILAGLALDGGQTIAVWLPQAAAEIRTPARIDRSIASTEAAPGLSVVLSDGKRLQCDYLGLDGTTGLSILRANSSVITGTQSGREPREGQLLRILAPQRGEPPVNPAPYNSPGTIFVRVGEVAATLAEVTRTSNGRIDHLVATGSSLSSDFVGGIAIDDAGATVGIVEGVEQGRARILPASAVVAAVQRVVTQQASVPRPLLGVRGGPMEPASRAFLRAHGWEDNDIGKFFEHPSGFLLTSVLPGTPAAAAQLRPGDVIVRVNDFEVKNELDFTSLLGEAGSGANVNFTVLRPAQSGPASVAVKLGSSLDPMFGPQNFAFPGFASPAAGPLGKLGIETFALSPRFAAPFGTQGGLLVIGVQLNSPAARAGVREGDIVESVDGRSVMKQAPVLASDDNYTLGVIRDNRRVEIAVRLEPAKKP